MNKVSFGRLYMDQLPGLYRLAQSILRHPADAQDAVQQAVLQAWLHMDHIRAGSEKSYLARIVINECHNIQRSRRRTVPVPEFPDRAVPSSGLAELRDAVNRLPEKLKVPFLLVYMEGFTAQEAAARVPGALRCTPCGEAVHVFTHVEWHITGYLIDC